MKVVIGADHRGFPLKEELKKYLQEKNQELQDIGAFLLNEKDDYTQYAEKVASLVSVTSSTKGVLLCGSGAGVDIVANKFDGVRSTIGLSGGQIMAARRDDDINVLVIASDFTNKSDAIQMLEVFLNTEFDHKKRHERRLDEISKIEKNN